MIPSSSPALPREPIRLNEAGTYGDLMDRPNPGGFVVQPVPPFEMMLPFLNRISDRELTKAEIEIERRRAPSIVLTKEGADRLAASRVKRPRPPRP